MTLLLISYVCDTCDGPPQGTFYRGFVVWRAGDSLPRRHYVFRTRETAERWRRLRGLEDAEIREVLSEQPIRWHLSRGTIKDLELADHVFDIFPDHRYPPAPHRGFLAPRTAASSEEVVFLRAG